MAKTPASIRSLYESIFIIRQDVSYSDVDRIAEEFGKLIKDYKGEVIKQEYWGIRDLAYEIDNNSKGHYLFLGFASGHELLTEFNRKVKLNESVIRSSLVRVESIQKEPSDILKEEDNNVQDNVVELKQNSARPSKPRWKNDQGDDKNLI